MEHDIRYLTELEMSLQNPADMHRLRSTVTFIGRPSTFHQGLTKSVIFYTIFKNLIKAYSQSFRILIIFLKRPKSNIGSCNTLTTHNATHRYMIFASLGKILAKSVKHEILGVSTSLTYWTAVSVIHSCTLAGILAYILPLGPSFKLSSWLLCPPPVSRAAAPVFALSRHFPSG